MAQYEALLEPLRIKDLTIRNRFLSTSHQPLYNDHGRPSERYIRYQVEKAKGGIGLAQCGGSPGVAPENSYYYGQINASTDTVVPYLRDLATRLQEHGAACTIQLTHGGRRERWDKENWLPAVAPSRKREPIHCSFPKEMEDWDFDRIREGFARAARRCRDAGIDGVEIAFSSQTLIEQFWSPETNLRSDDYGGSLENRMRFGFEVLRAVRDAVGDDYVVGIRMPGDEMIKEGLSGAQCVEIARAHAGCGMIDFISVVGGVSKDYLNSAKLWPSLWLPNAAYLHMASAIKAEVDIPVFHAARITDLATAERAVAEGHLDMVGMTRAFISDPHFPRKLMEGREDDIRPCTGASYCLDTVLAGIGTICIQNAATGREERMPHVVPRAEGSRKKVVVVGAGPGGLEAARVSAERGHEVVLFERSDRVGGQIHLTTKLGWRQGIAGIHQWLDSQVRKLGVDLRLGVEATAQAVLAEAPDIVIVATGGRPDKGDFEGAELCASTWDILEQRVQPAESVLIYDDQAAYNAPVCTEFMADRGSQIEIVTPDRKLLAETQDITFTPHLVQLYKRGVLMTTDQRLVGADREGNKLVAVLRNEFVPEMEEERAVDQIVAEHGTTPNDELYSALRPDSRNLGAVDLQKLAEDEPPTVVRNPTGAFELFRVGDAVAGRNIHAAIYDSLRFCKNF